VQVQLVDVESDSAVAAAAASNAQLEQLQKELESTNKRLEFAKRQLDQRDSKIAALQDQLSRAKSLSETEHIHDGDSHSSPMVRIKFVAGVTPDNDDEVESAASDDPHYWRTAYKTLHATMQAQQQMQRDAMASMLKKARELTVSRPGAS